MLQLVEDRVPEMFFEIKIIKFVKSYNKINNNLSKLTPLVSLAFCLYRSLLISDLCKSQFDSYSSLVLHFFPLLFPFFVCLGYVPVFSVTLCILFVQEVVTHFIL